MSPRESLAQVLERRLELCQRGNLELLADVNRLRQRIADLERERRAIALLTP